MGISSEMRDGRVSRTRSPPLVVAASPNEKSGDAIREAVMKGSKAAAITGLVVAVPTLAVTRLFPWVKTGLNHSGKTVIISFASIYAFFFNAEKSITARTRADGESRMKHDKPT